MVTLYNGVHELNRAITFEHSALNCIWKLVYCITIYHALLNATAAKGSFKNARMLFFFYILPTYADPELNEHYCHYYLHLHVYCLIFFSFSNLLFPVINQEDISFIMKSFIIIQNLRQERSTALPGRTDTTKRFCRRIIINNNNRGQSLCNSSRQERHDFYSHNCHRSRQA